MNTPQGTLLPNVFAVRFADSRRRGFDAHGAYDR